MRALRREKNLTIFFENAYGNPSIATQIAQKFAGLPLDVVVPLSTSSAQTVVQHIKTMPIVFAGVSDPLEAKLVPSLTHPGGHITGVADVPPLEDQVDFIQQQLPHLATLGMIYNPGEANSDSFLKNMLKLAKRKGIKVKLAIASQSVNVQAAAHSLSDQVEAIFVGNDNTVVSGLEPLVKVYLDAKIPLFVSDPESVKRGALAAYAYDQKSMGRQAGKIVAKVLRGEKPGKIPVEIPTELKVYVNEKTAKKLNITIFRERNHRVNTPSH